MRSNNPVSLSGYCRIPHGSATLAGVPPGNGPFIPHLKEGDFWHRKLKMSSSSLTAFHLKLEVCWRKAAFARKESGSRAALAWGSSRNMRSLDFFSNSLAKPLKRLFNIKSSLSRSWHNSIAVFRNFMEIQGPGYFSCRSSIFQILLIC